MNRTTARLSTAAFVVAATVSGCFFTSGGSAGTEPAASSGSGSSGSTVVVAQSGGGAAGGAGPAASAGPPGQWSLAEREYWTQLQSELDDYVRQMNAECHTSVTATYVHDTFHGRLTEGGSYGLSSYMRGICAAPLTAIRSICQAGAMQQQAVSSRVQRIECAFGGTNYSLNGGVVRLTGNPDQNNGSGYESEFTTWMRNQL